MIKENNNGKLWRSLESLNADSVVNDELHREFPEGASENDESAPSRRDFMGIMGAGIALAGGAMAGCVRKPQEKIYPYSQRPENTIPGKPRFFATSAPVAGVVSAFLVESHDGRPTKIEGNPDHVLSGGAASALSQATVLNLYDVNRVTKAYQGAEAKTLADFNAWLDEQVKSYGDGAGLAVLTGHRASPTTQRLLADLEKAYPAASIYKHDETDRVNARSGAAQVGAQGHLPFYDIGKSSVMVAFDSDFLGSEGDSVSHTRGFSEKRRVNKPGDAMNRLYVIEPTFTVTGAAADHRLQCASSNIGSCLAAIAIQLKKMGVKVAASDTDLNKLKTAEMDAKWATAAAKDLKDAGKKALVLVGERQPAHLHALQNLINDALGANGTTVKFIEEVESVNAGSLTELTAALEGGKAKNLFMLDVNAVYSAPADVAFSAALGKADNVVYLGMHKDETAAKAGWTVGLSHFLESWGDWQFVDGSVGLQQPLIAPLYDTTSENELLARLVGKAASSHELVQQSWKGNLEGLAWRKALHSGIAAEAATPSSSALSVDAFTTVVAGLEATAAVSDSNMEINFVMDPKVVDGRYANNGWLQELPDPMTKLTWDNAILLNVKEAAKLDIHPEPKKSGEKSYQMAELVFDGRPITMPVFIAPGLADNTVTVNIGYGREGELDVAAGVGFNVNTLRTSAASSFGTGATLKKVSGSYKLACTQDHWWMGPDEHENEKFSSFEERPLVRETTKDAYKAHPNDLEPIAVVPPHTDNPWEDVQKYDTGNQWGMSIDLNACTGCNACTIACQSENNIPVVGKDRVLRGREMHWIRLDRYYRGDQNDPEAVYQPMACAHCEMAPCESVCPVAATTHSPDGLNDMAYNRCIGTRYCSNNCPFKVRRFNFFAYNFTTSKKENFWDDYKKLYPVEKMQKNPDVTVRFRGVMEKCTYCVQRINEAKIHAKAKGDGLVKDGEVVVACEQTCPAGAIVFGDVNDPNSRVSRAKAQQRDYGLLDELNLRPRTTFLAKLRNPNPALVTKTAASHEGHDHG